MIAWCIYCSFESWIYLASFLILHATFLFLLSIDLSVLSPDVPVAPQQISQRPSCLVRDQRPLDSPSKRVSFSVANKENILASNSSNEINGKPQRPSKKCLLNLEEKFNNADRLSDVERRAALFRYPFVKPWPTSSTASVLNCICYVPETSCEDEISCSIAFKYSSYWAQIDWTLVQFCILLFTSDAY